MSHYHADGHTLTLRIEDGFIAFEVECPGEGKCEGLREFGGPDDPETCIVQYNAREVGTEFLEWQEMPYRYGESPCEIEWYDWGTSGTYYDEPEYEFFWRPADTPSRRWDHGMTGWRARVTYSRGGASQEGEITGYEHPGMVCLVMDGEEDPIKVNWCDVRPA